MALTDSQPAPLFERGPVLEGVAQQVVGDVRQSFSRVRLEEAATTQERLRLAHELHDGLLQSLTGLALQLQALSQLLDTDLMAARRQLHEIQTLVSSEQRDLRTWITNLSAPEAAVRADDLAATLRKICRRAEWQWRFSCQLSIEATAAVPRTFGDHICRIVQEGINNAGRHARAHRVRVAIAVRPERVDIDLSDDGVGFPFHGQYDLARLTVHDIGPRSLKARVGSLHGNLVLTTGLSGSRLQIGLPQPTRAWSAPRQIASD